MAGMHRLGSLLVAILLVEGFVSLSSEVIAIRQVSVFAGTGIDVVSVVIGIYLLALACGYAAGGRIRSGIRKRLTRNLLIAAVGYALVFSFGLLLAIDRLLDSRWLFVVFVSLAGVFPIGFVTSQTVPLVTNYMRRGHVGEISSRVLFISTAGSFAASIVVPVVLMQWIGVAATVAVLAALIALLALRLAKGAAQKLAAGAIFAATLLLNPLNPTFHLGDRSLHVVSDNPYATTSILESPRERTLMVNKSHASVLPLVPEAPLPPYIRMLRQIVAGLGEGMRILVVGAGGFSVSDGDHVNHYTYVDINPDLKAIAEKDFLQHAVQGEFIAEDALAWLRRYPQRFDLVILDAYQARSSVPPLLTTREFYELAREHVGDNGWVAANIIQANPMSRRDKGIDATLRSVFATCFTWPGDFGYERINVIYMCHGRGDGTLPRINTLDRFYSLTD